MSTGLKTLLLLLLCGQVAAQLQTSAASPKLVLQITVDQLRGDLPLRLAERYGEGGFRYLLDHGVWYTDAHHPQANTETIVGHVNLATGAEPRRHGMIANHWLDRASNRIVYCLDDNRYPQLDSAAEKTGGRSPRNIQSPTTADQLFIASAGQAKIFSVSGKDRGAIAMAGQHGKAFWYSSRNGHFTSSRFYYPQYPHWVMQWNKQQLADRYTQQPWQLSQAVSQYLFARPNDRTDEADVAGFGRNFPHAFGAKTTRYATLKQSPVLDRLTVDFAKQLIGREQLGADQHTDYLAISLSATDYIGHLFGPNSLESEDNQLQLDKTLADLLAFVDRRIGLQHVLISLSADHGVPDLPAYSASRGLDAQRLDVNTISRAISQILASEFDRGESLLQRYYHPYIYLDQTEIARRGLNPAAVEQRLAQRLRQHPGIALAVSSRALMAADEALNEAEQKVRLNHYPARSGDIYLGWPQYWSVFYGREAVNHGSIWRYDSHVPVVFAGMNLSAARISRRISTLSVAPTLSALMTLPAPAHSSAPPLQELTADTPAMPHRHTRP